jgi:acetyl-CoA acetyltransferase
LHADQSESDAIGFEPYSPANGGSLGIGHPLGATGTRLVVTVAKELRRSSTRYGLATQCIGASMGITTVLEALD